MERATPVSPVSASPLNPRIDRIDSYINLGDQNFVFKEPMPDETARRRSSQQIKMDRNVSMPPELFEKLMMRGNVEELKPRGWGNPRPIAIVGFLLCLGPLSCDLMAWRGAGGNGAAGIPAYLFIGGVLMLFGGIVELFMGETFPAVVFSSFGGFWLTFGATALPQFNAYAAYTPTDAADIIGKQTKGFNASFGFFTLWMGVLCFVYLICSLRANLVFTLIFFSLVFDFGFVTTVYWLLADNFVENADRANNFLVASGAFGFITTLLGWYVLVSLLADAVELPFRLPLCDLSGGTPGTRPWKSHAGEF